LFSDHASVANKGELGDCKELLLYVGESFGLDLGIDGIVKSI
jgi:hypothetical protein